MASERAPQESFEALYQRLEETVARLEAGGLTLEESLALYEEGAKLAERCQALLKNAEQRISKLRESFADGVSAAREEPSECGPAAEETDTAE